MDEDPPAAAEGLPMLGSAVVGAGPDPAGPASGPPESVEATKDFPPEPGVPDGGMARPHSEARLPEPEQAGWSVDWLSSGIGLAIGLIAGFVAARLAGRPPTPLGPEPARPVEPGGGRLSPTPGYVPLAANGLDQTLRAGDLQRIEDRIVRQLDKLAAAVEALPVKLPGGVVPAVAEQPPAWPLGAAPHAHMSAVDEANARLAAIVESYRRMLAEDSGVQGFRTWANSHPHGQVQVAAGGIVRVADATPLSPLIAVDIGDRLRLILPGDPIIRGFATRYNQVMNLSPEVGEAFAFETNGGRLQLLEPAIAENESGEWRLAHKGRLGGLVG